MVDGDIWRYRLRVGHALERLSVTLSSVEYSPVGNASGTLFFASSKEGQYGQGDLYDTRRSAQGWEPAVRLFLSMSLNAMHL